MLTFLALLIIGKYISSAQSREEVLIAVLCALILDFMSICFAADVFIEYFSNL